MVLNLLFEVLKDDDNLKNNNLKNLYNIKLLRNHNLYK